MSLLPPHLTRYFQLVDAALTKIASPDERETMLAREIAKQEILYETWMAKIDAGLPVDPTVTAFDFHETFAGLEQRRERKAA